MAIRPRVRFSSWCVQLGLASGASYGPHGAVNTYWRGRRCMFLGWTRDQWRCLLRYGHWPGPRVGFGNCGKCVPWQCCGSTSWGHTSKCLASDRRRIYGDDEADHPTPERPY